MKNGLLTGTTRPALQGRLLRGSLLLLSLSGCATTRYVTTPCLTAEQYEKLKSAEPPKVHDQLTGQADQDIRPIAGNAIRLRAWGTGLLGILEGCSHGETH